MRKLYLLPLFIAFGITSHAQVNSSNLCGHSQAAKQLAESHPELAATINKSKTKSSFPHYLQKDLSEVYIIPVVFHIVHENGTENISDVQIQDALRILNRDFRAQNPDTAFVATPFQGLPADARIEFRMALRAPDGTCFNGITRTVSATTNAGGFGQLMVDAVIAGNDVYQGIWPHHHYMNVFVGKDIGASGYALHPMGDTSQIPAYMNYNGIFMMSDCTGSIGTSDEYKSRTLTHEVGHWLNLYHTWGYGTFGDLLNCGPEIDDYVEDTPDCRGIFECNLELNSCYDDDGYWGIPMVDNVENYMEYSHCSKMFTLGQTTRMRDAILSDVGGRSNLWTEENLNKTGVLSGVSFCNINFEADRTALCAGTSVSFEPSITQGIATYSWTFTGGSLNTSTNVNPIVTYPADGNYDVTLTVTSLLDGTSYSIEKTMYITVGNAFPTFEGIGPFCEGEQLPPLPGASLNGLNGTWNPGVINNQVSQNYTFTPAISECAADDYVMSIVINPLPDVTMNELPPCTSDQPFQLSGGLPVNGGYFGEGIVGGYFLPDSAGIGTHIITYVYTNSFGCSSSASIAFDVDNCLGLKEMEYSDLSIYPNPSSGKITIESEANPILTYSLIDLTGKCLMTGTKNANKIEIDLAAFPNGYYVVELTTASSMYRNSVVIQK